MLTSIRISNFHLVCTLNFYLIWLVTSMDWERVYSAKYCMLVGMVDVIFSDVAQPDQVCFLSFMSLLVKESLFANSLFLMGNEISRIFKVITRV